MSPSSEKNRRRRDKTDSRERRIDHDFHQPSLRNGSFHKKGDPIPYIVIYIIIVIPLLMSGGCTQCIPVDQGLVVHDLHQPYL